jgi:hypothetical protein
MGRRRPRSQRSSLRSILNAEVNRTVSPNRDYPCRADLLQEEAKDELSNGGVLVLGDFGDGANSYGPNNQEREWGG